jgi:hypothetical protein
LDRASGHILNQLRNYDTFLDNLKVVADMGCGTGEDITWFATLETRDDPPEPYNYKCYAIDQDQAKLDQVPDLENIIKIKRNFNELCIPVKVDFMFAHDCLQFSTNPLETLNIWNQQMNVNGMLAIAVPCFSGVKDHLYYSRAYTNQYFHYTPANLIHMLAVNGFDCRDAYLHKVNNDPWIRVAVYKAQESMDPATTTFNDLIDKKLLHPSIVNSIIKHGEIRQEEIVMPWLDRENYAVDYVTEWTEIPEGTPTVDLNENKITKKSSSGKTLVQKDKTQVHQESLKKVSIMRLPKQSFVNPPNKHD